MNIPPGRIIVSPDGPNIPYEALIMSKRNTRPVKYLVQDYAVSYTFSAQFLERVPGSSVAKEKSKDFLAWHRYDFNSSFQLVPLPGE